MNAVQKALGPVVLGERQAERGVLVYPLFSGEESPLQYLTMDQAMEGGFLTVAEVTAHGHVPELRVCNGAATPVLLVDGEELAGAKQNRVLNTTILLRENSETVIPRSSCTEHGRWAYTTDHFKPSGVVMSRSARAHKVQSVSESLSAGAHFASDQGQVWQQIAHLHAQAKVSSPTGAMHDAFVAHDKELRAGLAVFRTLPGQKGLLVILRGEVVGLDLFSLAGAYARLHPKLVRSYLLEALLQPPETAADPEQTEALARAFLEETLRCQVREYPSVGYGQACRLQGETIVGSGLVHAGGLIHAAVFRLAGSQRSGAMASLRWRRFNQPNRD